MSSIARENMCFLTSFQSNWLKLLILKEKVAFSDDLFKMVRDTLPNANYFNVLEASRMSSFNCNKIFLRGLSKLNKGIAPS